MDGELNLDELAERAGVSARTIRYYQSEGVVAVRAATVATRATTPDISNDLR